MATRFWTGASDNAFSTAGNWNPSGSPVAADDLIFGDQATANCDGSDESGTGLFSSLSVVKGFNLFTIGSAGSGNSLDISCTNVTIDAPGSKSDGINGIYIEGKNIANCWVRNCGFLNLSGNFDFLQIMRGKVTLEGTGADVPLAMSAGDTFIITFVNSRLDSDVTIGVGAVLPTTTEVEIYGGKITNNADITTINCRNAQWTNTAGDITTLRLQSGNFTWNDGNITLCEVGPAKLIGSQSDSERTCTTLKMLHVNTGIDFNDGAGNISVTNPILYEGGTIKIASNQTLALDT